MSALVSYGSSDEEGEAEQKLGSRNEPVNGDGYLIADRPTIGPSRLTEAHNDQSTATLMDFPTEQRLEDDARSPPQSPYTANRALIRDFTLPSKPNLDIPPSPPGSPPPGMDDKFAHFLELKKEGVHFNEKLARSSALRNPALLQKLMTYAGMSEREQYSTTIPGELCNPTDFPTWAYKEELAKSQREVSQRKEGELVRTRRETIDFIPAGVSGNVIEGATLRAGSAAKGMRSSAAERVMAGLNREKSRSPRTSGGPRRGGR